ncbi:YncE family protein [Dactylosporangium cerinum]
MRRVSLLSLVLVALLTGCDAGAPVDRPDATVPTPTWAPVPSVSPAGTVVPVGGPPLAVAVGSSLTAVGLASSLVVLDASGARVASVPVPDPVRAVVALPDGRFRAVSGSTVLTVSPSSPSPSPSASLPASSSPSSPSSPSAVAVARWTIAGAGAALAVHPSGWTAVAVPSLGDVIILSSTGAVTRTLHVGDRPGGVAVVAELLAVLDPAETSLTVYDTTTGARKEGLRAGDGAVTVTSDGTGRFLVIDARDGELLAFETGPLILRQRFPVPGTPYAAAYDPTHNTLWVTVTERNEVVGYDLTGGTPREVTRHPTPRLPIAVAVDPSTGTVVVAGSAEGLVQRISP